VGGVVSQRKEKKMTKNPLPLLPLPLSPTPTLLPFILHEIALSPCFQVCLLSLFFSPCHFLGFHATAPSRLTTSSPFL
jgi:hypothetical protein